MCEEEVEEEEVKSSLDPGDGIWLVRRELLVSFSHG